MKLRSSSEFLDKKVLKYTAFQQLSQFDNQIEDGWFYLNLFIIQFSYLKIIKLSKNKI